MYMRYTHFGIGHSAMLRKIIRDCLGSHLVASNAAANSGNQGDADDEETYEGEGRDECNDRQEGSDDSDEGEEECGSDDELSDGELVKGVGEDNGEEYGDELDDELYGISF